MVMIRIGIIIAIIIIIIFIGISGFIPLVSLVFLNTSIYMAMRSLKKSLAGKTNQPQGDFESYAYEIINKDGPDIWPDKKNRYPDYWFSKTGLPVSRKKNL